MTFVLDASALLRFLDDEEGAETVSAALQKVTDGYARAVMSAIHFGEIIGISYKRGGQSRADRIAARIRSLHIQSMDATTTRATHSAIVKQRRKIPYADSFAVDLASDSPQHILITADFDFIPAQQDIQIEFLPPKPKAPTGA